MLGASSFSRKRRSLETPEKSGDPQGSYNRAQGAAVFDAPTSFETEVRNPARATAELAEERQAMLIALAELSVRGDRIDRVQSENRAILNHLIAG